MIGSAHDIGVQARALHRTCRLAGTVENELLTLPDSLIAYLAGLLRQTPCTAPDCATEDWERFLALLGPHWIYATLYWRIRNLPEECRTRSWRRCIPHGSMRTCRRSGRAGRSNA